MNVKKLSKFRSKLVNAKKLYEVDGFVGDAPCKAFNFVAAGLVRNCADIWSAEIMPSDVYAWYVNPCRSAAERIAMWDNSIAAIDARIAKAK